RHSSHRRSIQDRQGPAARQENVVNDSNDNWGREPAETAETSSPTSTDPLRRASGSQKTRIVGALIIGGVTGAAILGPISTLAASPDPSASAATVAPSVTTGAG